MQKKFFSNHIVTAILLLTAGLAGSCKKLIEIPSSPPSEITQSDQFADSSVTMAAVAQVYSYIGGGSSGFGYADGLLSAATGLSSDELTYPTPIDASLLAFYNYGLDANNSDIAQLWASPYTSLYTVNAVLSGVDGSPGLSVAFRKQVKAEMKVVRALYYFNLVNLFGGLPLATTTDYRVNAGLSRTSVDSVYGQIIADLTDARQNLMASYPSAGHIRPSQQVATALLARTYLYRQRWQDAYNAADAVISSGEYSLVDDPDQVFLDGSSEAIWQIPATGTFQVTQEAMNYIPQVPGTVPVFPISSYLLNAFETDDLRMQDWLGQSIVNGQTLYYPYKYKNILTSSPTTEDYMIIRLAELYLIRAEASAELGNGVAALADLNIVRTRAGLAASTADPGSQPGVLSAIMHERQVELFTEWGNRWYDLKRTGAAGTVLAAEKPSWTANAVLYPLPLPQLQIDLNLKQNAGY